jgi:two-component system, chemotaxis family, CheB/CheR fusion protein
LNLTAADIGRPITDLRLKVDLGDLAAACHAVFDNRTVKEWQVKDREGRTYALTLRAFRGADYKVDGVMLTLYGPTRDCEGEED